MKKCLWIFVLLFAVFIMSNGVLAQTSTTTTIMGQHAVDSLSGAIDKIPTSVPGWILGVLAFLIEIAMRFYPTAQPRSVFLLIGTVFHLMAAGCQKISDLLDILIQNVSAPK